VSCTFATPFQRNDAQPFHRADVFGKLRLPPAAAHVKRTVGGKIGQKEETMNSQYFYRLDDALRGLDTDPATAADPKEHPVVVMRSHSHRTRR
jgi:hypothetical protein